MAPDIVRKAFISTLIVAAALVAAAFALRSTSGLVGAGFATLIVLGFFMSSHLFVTYMMNKDVSLGMTAALAMYVVKILVMLLLVMAFRETTLFDTKVFALTIVILTLTWTFVEVFFFSKSKTLTVVPGSGPEHLPPPRTPEF